MASINDVQIQLEQRDNTREPVREFTPAQLLPIDFPDSAKVNGKADYVWVSEVAQPQSVFQILNRAVPPVPNSLVLIGYPAKPPYVRQIISAWDGTADYPGFDETTDGSFNVPLHAASHQYPSESNKGTDPVTIYRPAIDEGKVVPNTNLIVEVRPLIYTYNSRKRTFVGGFVDLTNYVPANSGASVLLLLYLDKQQNRVFVEEGTPSASPTYPTFLPDTIPLAYARLSSGQGVVVATDIEDTRIWLTGGVSTFDALLDTPVSKVGFAGQSPTVNADETGLEYVEFVPKSGGTFDGDLNVGSLGNEGSLSVLSNSALPFMVQTTHSNSVIDLRYEHTRNVAGSDGDGISYISSVPSDTAGVPFVAFSHKVTAYDVANQVGGFELSPAKLGVPTTVIEGTGDNELAFFGGTPIPQPDGVDAAQAIMDLGLGINITGGGGGASTFDSLTDTPANKVGEAFKILQVNVAETALEYADYRFQTYLDLTDTPAPGSYVGNAGYSPIVNPGETALEFEIFVPQSGGTFTGSVDVLGDIGVRDLISVSTVSGSERLDYGVVSGSSSSFIKSFEDGASTLANNIEVSAFNVIFKNTSGNVELAPEVFRITPTDFDVQTTNVGFYGTTPIAQPDGVDAAQAIMDLGLGINITNGGGGVSTFDGLTDTPAAKTGFAGYSPTVNVGETALEYVEFVPKSGGVFTGIVQADAGLSVVNNLLVAFNDAEVVNNIVVSAHPGTERIKIGAVDGSGSTFIQSYNETTSTDPLDLDIYGKTTTFYNSSTLTYPSSTEVFSISPTDFSVQTDNVGFYGATPIAQPDGVDAAQAIMDLGLGINITSGGGATTYDALTDTTASKTGAQYAVPYVNAIETTLDYSTVLFNAVNRVGIGTAAPDSLLHVAGDLQVEGTTEPNLLLVNAGNDKVAINGQATVDLTTTAAAPKTAVIITSNFSPSTSPGTVYPGALTVKNEYDATYNIGGFSLAQFLRVDNVGNGTQNARCLDVQYRNLGTGTVGNCKLLSLRSPVNSGGGAVTTAYGLYIENQTVATNNYAIWTGTGMVRFGGGVQVGSPTGGDKGAGTINVGTNIFKNNTAYTNPDYALEYWATGGIVKYARSQGAGNYKRYSLDELERYIMENWRLPGITDEPAGIFDMADIALEKIEELYTHIIELHHRLEALED